MSAIPQAKGCTSVEPSSGKRYAHCGLNPRMSSMVRAKLASAFSLVVALAATVAWNSPEPSGMVFGSPTVQSLGHMAFGPGNVLFIGDNDGAQILAVEIADAPR